MSVHPVLAALAGLVLLGQWLHLHEWAGIAIVIGVNAALVILDRPAPAPRRPAAPGTPR